MSNTITFSEKNKGWTSFHGWDSKLMAKLNNRFFGFKNGQLWLFNDATNPVRNNFFGEQLESKIETVINVENSEDKVFKTLVYEGNKPWSATLKTNYTEGVIHKEEFNHRESKWYAHTRGNEDESSYHGGVVQGLGDIISVTGQFVFYDAVSEFVDVGDRLFQMNAEVPELIGVVSETATDRLKIDTFTTTPVVGRFSFTKKNERVEGGEIRGYYMNVFMESDATDAVELFAIQSNIIKSHV